MQRPVQITFRDIAHSEAIESHVREKVAKLEEFYPQITGCHVTLEMPHKHKHQGKQCSVRIDVRVPGGELVVNHDKHEDMYVALRDAFDAAKRQLEAYADIQSGDVKSHSTPPAPPTEAAE